MYRPSNPFNVPLLLLKPIYGQSMGVQTKTYPTEGTVIFCSFRTFGGTETNNNGVIAVEDTATIETWYNPDITTDCRLEDSNGKQYEIMGTPENISMRNQFMIVKLKAVKGGA